jgi:hypothetical protein
VAAFLIGADHGRNTAAAPGPGTAADVALTPGSTPTPSAPASPSPSPSPSVSPSAKSPAAPSAGAAVKPGPVTLAGWPNARNTGVPAGTKLRSCSTKITKTGTYAGCRFAGGVTVRANRVKITHSLITGTVDAGSGPEQSGLVISDSTIDCGCPADADHAPASIMDSNYTLLRVNLFGSGHGAAVQDNVTIQDSYIHGLGANTDAHKDGIYAGDGSNVVLRHNNIECNDGSRAGCTAAIGLLTDFGDITHWTIDNNLLNTNGSYCFYASGGPSKKFGSNHIVFVNNHFGRSIKPNCGANGPVAYFDSGAPGNVWSRNVWADSNTAIKPEY